MKHKQTFIVDIGKTMVDTNRIASEGKDKQKLFCKCGHIQTYNAKVKRNVIKNQDTTVEDKESLQSIKCASCKITYNYDNKSFLLMPEKEEIFCIKYSVVKSKNSKNEDILTLYKNKFFAGYSLDKDKLNIINRIDFIQLNKTTKKANIFLSHPLADEDGNNSTNIYADKSAQNNVSEELTVSHLIRLDSFFKFFEFVQYENLDQAFEFFRCFEDTVIDLDAIKKIPSINYIYKNSEILEEKNAYGNTVYYQMVDSGYGDGKKNKKTLSIGSHLSRVAELAKIFFAVNNFQNVTTILLTKGKEFFIEFLKSSNICDANVYVNNDATSPIKILEVSTNFDKIGTLKRMGKSSGGTGRKKNKDTERNYLKLSPIIYKHIKNPSDMDVLYNVYLKEFLDKADFETLFNDFETERLYKLFRQLDRKNNDEVAVSIKHIRHILKENLDDPKHSGVGGGYHDFLNLYTDTLRTIGLLELPDNYIFRIKNNNQLREIHDDLAARYNAVRDAKKAEFYKKAANEFAKLTATIGDISFTVIPSLESLNKEGMTMNHCIYTYLSRICEKNYLAVHVQHILSNERATLGLNRHGKGLAFDQLKGYRNSRASREMIEATVKFCKENDIDMSRGSSSDLTPSKSGQVRMHDYLTDEEVEKLRAERAKKEKKLRGKKQKDGNEIEMKGEAISEIKKSKPKKDSGLDKMKNILGSIF